MCKQPVDAHNAMGKSDTLCPASQSSTTLDHHAVKRPVLKRVVLFNKMTRWEVLYKEAQENPVVISEIETQFPGIEETHRIHCDTVDYILKELRDVHGLDVEVVKAQRACTLDISAFDAIISAGGDGTFLEAASLVKYTALPCYVETKEYSFTKCLPPAMQHHPFTHQCSDSSSTRQEGVVSEEKPRLLWVFGLNTDPTRSEGRLLMKPQKILTATTPTSSGDTHQTYTAGRDETGRDKTGRDETNSIAEDYQLYENLSSHYRNLSSIIQRLLHGAYQPLLRRRLRVSIVDQYPVVCEGACRNTSLNESTTLSCTPVMWMALDIAVSHALFQVSYLQKSPTSRFNDIKFSQSALNSFLSESPKDSSIPQDDAMKTRDVVTLSRLRVLEYRAVNDVLLSNLHINHTMYVELCVDDGVPFRSKNSGILVCTGSGSTAWAFNVSRVSEENVEAIASSFIRIIPPKVLETLELPSIPALTAQVNAAFVFEPHELKMRYVIREPIENRVFKNSLNSSFCKRICLTPLTVNSCLHLDGMNAVPVSYGQTICIEIGHEEDRLLTAV